MDLDQHKSPKQLLLFEEENCLRNQGKVFNRYKALYPRGDKVDLEIKLIEFLIEGFQNAPVDSPDKPIYIYRFWTSFEDYVKSLNYEYKTIVSKIKRSFFTKIVETIDQCDLATKPYLSDTIPTGYFYIQTGQYDLAIKYLQGCIPITPDNAAIYGYLGDTYFLRGETGVARHCYREACLVDPAGIDWHHMKDKDLLELRDRLMNKYGPDKHLALEWLPGHAFIEGLFELKVIKLNEGLKELVDEYLALEKAFLREERPELKAKLFFRGIILCGNEQALRFVKKVSFIDIRRLMKDVNPDLFSRYLLFVSDTNRDG